MGTGVTVRLEGRNNAPLRPSLTCRCQRRLDFHWMMTVVVHDHDSLWFSLNGETASDTAERRKTFLNSGERYIKLKRHGDAGHRVQDVVRAGHWKGDFTESIPFEVGDKRCLKPFMSDVGGTDISLCRKAVSHIAFFYQRQNLADIFVIEAEYRKAIKGNLVDKLDEGFFDLFDAGIMVEVIGINVCYHSDSRRKQ